MTNKTMTREQVIARAQSYKYSAEAFAEFKSGTLGHDASENLEMVNFWQSIITLLENPASLSPSGDAQIASMNQHAAPVDAQGGGAFLEKHSPAIRKLIELGYVFDWKTSEWELHSNTPAPASNADDSRAAFEAFAEKCFGRKPRRSKETGCYLGGEGVMEVRWHAFSSGYQAALASRPALSEDEAVRVMVGAARSDIRGSTITESDMRDAYRALKQKGGI